MKTHCHTPEGNSRFSRGKMWLFPLSFFVRVISQIRVDLLIITSINDQKKCRSEKKCKDPHWYRERLLSAS